MLKQEVQHACSDCKKCTNSGIANLWGHVVPPGNGALTSTFAGFSRRRSQMSRRSWFAVLAAVVAVLGFVPPAGAVTSTVFPSCTDSPQVVSRPFPSGTVLPGQYKVDSPPANHTYDLTSVTSTDYPDSVSAFAFGTSTPASDLCVQGGKVQGTVDPTQTWDYYHDTWNGSCVKVIGVDWAQVTGLRCDSEEDGVRPEETAGNVNNLRFTVTGTYLSTIRDDCVENDFTVGGVISDSLFESCNTGISERPASARGTWTSPASETLTLDHVLIGLFKTPHAVKGFGENAIFKWSSSANHVVISCSVFKVDEVSLNGRNSDAFPAGTVVDDSACPTSPSTIVWLGSGSYPAEHAGIRVVTSQSYWTDAVAAWKTSHGF